ncbi:MAG: VanZ family protein [bacterium]
MEFDDLILHFLEYCAFGFLLSRAVIKTPQKACLRLCMITVSLGVLYAASDEFHQLFVAGRFSEWSDLLADSAGVTVGLGIFLSFKKARTFLVGKRKSTLFKEY